MSDCRFGVSPVNYPDPDPEAKQIIFSCKPNQCFAERKPFEILLRAFE